MMKQKVYYLLLVLTLCLGFFLRFYKLGEVPNGLYQDETAIGYNAYSILKTGKDEYGVTLPVYFKSFGDYKLPVYILATVPSVAVFGMTDVAVRFPSAFFGVLSIFVFYFFVFELTKKRNLALLATFLLAINPWHLHYSRATFEVSICLFLFILGSYLLLKSFHAKKTGLFLLGTLCFVINIYCYNLTRLLSPVLFVSLIYFYRKQFSNVRKSEIIATCVLSVIVLLPFVETLLRSGGFQSAQGTLIFSSAPVQAENLEFRSYIAGNPLLSKMLFNNLFLNLWVYVIHCIAYLSVPFFFLTGSSHGNHGIGNVGQFYVFELVFILWGVYELLKNKEPWRIVIFGWFVVVVFVAAITREAPHATRSFFLLIPLTIISAYGIMTFVTFLIKLQKKHQIVIIAVVLAIAIYSIGYYFTSYYLRFPTIYAKSWRVADKDVALYLKAHENEYDHIIIDSNAGLIYSSLLFYQKYSPTDFHKTQQRFPDDSEGFSAVKSFGKYEYKEIDWTKDYKKPRTLLVTSADRKPNDVPSVMTFFYPERPVVISVKQTILAYPVKDVAYVLISTNK